jgi:hypothetical protein
VDVEDHRGDALDVSVAFGARRRTLGPEKKKPCGRRHGQGDQDDGQQDLGGAGQLDAARDLTALAMAVRVAVMTGDARLLAGVESC